MDAIETAMLRFRQISKHTRRKFLVSKIHTLATFILPITHISIPSGFPSSRSEAKLLHKFRITTALSKFQKPLYKLWRTEKTLWKWIVICQEKEQWKREIKMEMPLENWKKCLREFSLIKGNFQPLGLEVETGGRKCPLMLLQAAR